MPRFNMCFDISGIMECEIDADTLEEAVEEATDVDIAMVDYEKEEGDGE